MAAATSSAFCWPRTTKLMVNQPATAPPKAHTRPLRNIMPVTVAPAAGNAKERRAPAPVMTTAASAPTPRMETA